jgi:hypothetical protein
MSLIGYGSDIVFGLERQGTPLCNEDGAELFAKPHKSAGQAEPYTYTFEILAKKFSVILKFKPEDNR